MKSPEFEEFFLTLKKSVLWKKKSVHTKVIILWIRSALVRFVLFSQLSLRVTLDKFKLFCADFATGC